MKLLSSSNHLVTRCSNHRLWPGMFRMDIRKNFFIRLIVQHQRVSPGRWRNLLPIFKAWIAKALADHVVLSGKLG